MTRGLVRQPTLTLATCAVLVLSGVARAQSSEQLLAEVKTAWQARQDAIKSAQFTWGQKTLHPKGCWSQQPPLPPKDVLDDGTGSLLIDGERIRLETRMLVWHQPAADFFPRHRQVVFDGEKQVALDGPGVLNWHQATVSNKSRSKSDFRSLDLWPLTTAIRPFGPTLFIVEELDKFTSVRRVVLDTRNLIELSRPRGEVQGEMRMWVDPARGCAVVRYDEFLRDGQLLYRLDIRPAQRAGQWLPETWKVQVFGEKGRLRKQDEVTLRECVLNPDLPDEVFRIEFPVGTMVIDMSSLSERGRGDDVRYVVRENGDKRIIEPSERGLPHDQLMATPSGGLVPAHLRPWWKRQWVLPTGIGAALVVVGVALVIVGRRRRKADPPIRPAEPIAGQ